MTDYEQKYIKYKMKYCDLKQQLEVQDGGIKLTQYNFQDGFI